MRKLFFGLLLLLLGAVATPARAAPVATDRWIEIDLYWFDPADVAGSADRFWTRYAPLYRGTRGYRGIVLGIGLTGNYILDFSGDPDQSIVLPDTSGQELGHRIAGQLDGDTAARQRAWRVRFAPSPRAASIAYGHWTYRQLGRLTAAMRARARREGIDDFHVASFVIAQDSAYGAPMPFAARHPEAFTHWPAEAPGALSSSSHLDPANLLHADPRPLGGFPAGIREGLPVHALFAGQWAATAKATGLDGIMLRDSFSFPRPYTRYGPFGAYLPDPALAARSTGGLAALLRGVKQLSPATLTMMYSSAATATADWRANGIDLEGIAREGNLDIFVDQTWAGAWGEAGVREQTFWNAPILGWTYQLGYLLQHAAVLAGTRVHHYPLIETFDAWESWDTIHTAPERLRWAIWAYAHAGVKTPAGLVMPAGSYISWGNHGRDLLGADDVAFLAREMNAAARDAAATVDIAGPTMVYSREATAAGLARPANGVDPRDRLDEQVGSIVKWPLPILSATRAEWVPRIRSDLFLFGATAGMPDAQLRAVERLAAKGQPMAFVGAVDAATSPAIARLLHVQARPFAPRINDRLLRAEPGEAWPRAIMAARAFDAPPPQRALAVPSADIVYALAGGAGLVVAMTDGRNLSLWDPTPLQDYWYRPLKDMMNGDPAGFAIAAAVLNAQLAKAGALGAARVEVDQSGTVAAWSLRDGTIRLLAGNLEEGLRDDADRARTLQLRLPMSWRACGWRSVWSTDPPRPVRDVLSIRLPPQGSTLLDCAPLALRRH